MIYENILKAKFCSRPNRFVAVVSINGEQVLCHVKNTGRCRELLLPGCDIFIQRASSPERKTQYDLISVYKGERLINVDSQAPNKVFGEWLSRGDFFKNLTIIRPEVTFENSRFDFYAEAPGRKIFAEIKGVTLEENGIVLFPDAPTMRGVKHINELVRSAEQGYEAFIFFVVQMKGIKYFMPNDKTHPEFGLALRRAADRGVKVEALDCIVTENSLSINDFVEVRL